jgi:hypothetical protein
VEVEDLEARKDSPSSWTFLSVGEVAVGKEYYVFLTTTGGLCRYDINDVVHVEGFYGSTPEISFVRKGRGVTSLTGEKVSTNQIVAAVEKAAQETGLAAAHFRAEADAAAERYLFRVEFLRPPDPATARSFLDAVDRNLKAANLEYKSKRDSLRLRPPILHLMREGWYDRERRARVAAGKRTFQDKTDVLVPKKAETVAVRPEVERVIEAVD